MRVTLKPDVSVKGKPEFRRQRVIRIGDLAARSGVSPRALRYYEQQSLLAAARSTSGQRYYPEAAVHRVTLIQRLFAAGLSSRIIAVLLPVIDAQKASDEAVALLRDESESIGRQIEELIATRERLDEMIGLATTPGACTSPLTAPYPSLAEYSSAH